MKVLVCLVSMLFTSVVVADELVVSYSLPESEETRGFTDYLLDLRDYEFDDAGRLRFTYVLPEDLLGREDAPMRMFQIDDDDLPPNFTRFVCNRTLSQAICSISGETYACAVKFRGLAIDLSEVERFLIAKYGSSPETERRFLASSVFERDAIGNLTIVRK